MAALEQRVGAGEDGGQRRAKSFLRDHNRANAILPHKNTMRPPDGVGDAITLPQNGISGSAHILRTYLGDESDQLRA